MTEQTVPIAQTKYISVTIKLLLFLFAVVLIITGLQTWFNLSSARQRIEEEAGVQQTGQAGETIEQLATSIAGSAAAAQQVVASAQQQTTGIEQIALAMQNINQATQQNLASTRQAEIAAQGLVALARQMESLVAQYRLS